MVVSFPPQKEVPGGVARVLQALWEVSMGEKGKGAGAGECRWDG